MSSIVNDSSSSSDESCDDDEEAKRYADSKVSTSSDEFVDQEKKQARRNRIFKKYYDYDRYDTESYDDEVPLKQPHKKTSFQPGIDFNMPWLFETEEQETLRHAQEVAFGDIEKNFGSQPAIDSFFIENWIEDYLGGPIKHWKQITSSKQRVEIEPLDSDLFPPLRPYKPVLAEILGHSGKTITVKRVCGYRELMKKRTRVKHLRWIEQKEKIRSKFLLASESINVPVPVAKKYNTRKKCRVNVQKDATNLCIRNKSTEKKWLTPVRVEDETASSSSDEEATSKMFHSSTSSTTLSEIHLLKEWVSVSPLHHAIAVGGGEKKDDNKKKPFAERNYSIRKPSTFNFGTADVPKGLEIKPIEGSPGLVSEPSPMGTLGPITTTNPSIGKQVKPNPVIPTTSKSVPAFGSSKAKEKDIEEDDDYSDDDEDSNEFEEDLQKDVELSTELRNEKDNEWLQLSSSDSEEILFQYETIKKPKKKWMVEEANYESQNFARSLRIYERIECFFFRLPFNHRLDETMGMITYCVGRCHSIPFRITTMIIWALFIIPIYSVFDIKRNPDPVLYELEQFELDKYTVILLGFFIVLTFVGVWSLTIVLTDAFRICQFLNLITAALTKMEISGTRRIHKFILLELLITITSSTVLIGCFYFEIPDNFRGGMGFYAQLLCRPFIYRIRTTVSEKKLYYFEIVGLILLLICFICARILLWLMLIIAIVIGNLGKNWNFRFGLVFAQFGTQTRAHLYRLHLGQSMIMLFSHHRLVHGLIRIYGSVFAIPLIVLYSLEIIGISTILTFVFFTFASSDGGKGMTVIVPGSTTEVHSNSRSCDLQISFLVLGLITYELVVATEVLASASSAVADGYEFVRRHGLLRCNNSHERRLLMSLQWSLSAKNPAQVTVNNFYSVSRSALLSTIGFAIVIVSLIIQLKQVPNVTLILEVPCAINITRSNTSVGGINFTTPPNISVTELEKCYDVKSVPANEYERFVTANSINLNNQRTSTKNNLTQKP